MANYRKGGMNENKYSQTCSESGVDEPAYRATPAAQALKQRRPGVYAYHKHPVLLLPSGPDKVWAL